MMIPRRNVLQAKQLAVECYIDNIRRSSRSYSSHAPRARLNVPTDYSTTPLLHHTSRSALSSGELATSLKRSHGGVDGTMTAAGSTAATFTTIRQNLFTAINSALAHALRSDPRTLLFGEDVAFGGVFRCSMNLATEFGPERVFNTPLCEQGIVGFAIGAALQGMRPIAEIQFGDYVFPAFDQIVNEAAKIRFRSGTIARVGGSGADHGDDGVHCGGLVIRMPVGGVGHGALYHTQSPESLFTHVPGLRVVVPRSPSQAKGLLLAAVECPDPVIFMEPKILYRAAVEHVPQEAYTLPLDKADVIKSGEDVTVVAYGTPLYTCQAAIDAVEKDLKCSIELIDLRTIYPWDRQTVMKSVRKTGRCIVVHESMVNAGVGAEVAATVQEGCFLRLSAPVQRVAGWSTHTGLLYERFVLPDVARIYDSIRNVLDY
jgi:2-oxoisovalerate dehydrogenase E1 component beta subunit